jgi:hypothetical protein
MPRQKISQNEQKEMLRTELRSRGPWYYDCEANAMESGREAAKVAEQAMLPVVLTKMGQRSVSC